MPHTLPAPRHRAHLVVGRPTDWGRDLALVGAASATLAPMLVIGDPGFCLAAGSFAGASGWLLGWWGCHSVERARPWLPITVMVCLAPVVGAVWGASAGAFGGLFIHGGFPPVTAVQLGGLLGGVAGGLQVGALFLPYLIASTLRGPRWPVVVAAMMAAPALGWVAFAAMMMGAAMWPLGLLGLLGMVGAALWAEGRARRWVRA